jgi:hypothetical protein
MMKGIEKIKNKKERVSEDQDTGVSGNLNTRKTLSNFKPHVLISRFPDFLQRVYRPNLFLNS